MKIMMKMLSVFGGLAVLVGDANCSHDEIERQLKNIESSLKAAPHSVKQDIRDVFDELSGNIDKYIEEKSSEEAIEKSLGELMQIRDRLAKLLKGPLSDDEKALISMEVNVIRNILDTKENNFLNKKGDKLSELVEKSKQIKLLRFRRELERMIRVNTMYSIPEISPEPEASGNGGDESEQVSVDWSRSGH